MLRKYQKVFGALLGLALVHSASAFTVWGPAETWQTPDLDYITRPIEGGTELGGSKILGAGSRIGVPVISYGFDYTFAEYFGADGIAAIDQAMDIINGLPAASAASPNLTEFVTDGNQQINYTAQALGLFDLKSRVLTQLLEHLGLQGETHVFDLSAREAIPNSPPCNFDYYVINRNYDPITYSPSTIVNGIQFGYRIVDDCPVIDVGDAVEYPKDAAVNPELTAYFTAAATYQAQQTGGYYLNITRDDFGGLRWLYRQNHLINESIDPDSFVTSIGSSPWGSLFTGTNAGVTTNSTPTLFEGVEKVRFVKVPYDPLEGGFTPITYNYTKHAILNGRPVTVGLTRFIVQPDIIFTAADLVVRASPLIIPPLDARSIAFSAPPIASDGGGVLPNVILPQALVTFNNAYPLYANADPGFLSDANSLGTLVSWGSFGSSSAAPIVYPSGQSIIELENQVLSGSVTSGNSSTTWDPYGFGNVLTLTGGNVTFLGNY